MHDRLDIMTLDTNSAYDYLVDVISRTLDKVAPVKELSLKVKMH